MPDGSLSATDLSSLYRFMVLTRGLEEHLERLLKQGAVSGSVYRSLGQEATPVGSAFALEEGDWLSPSFRDLGALLVRGLSPLDVLLQHMGKSGSRSLGRDDTNHVTVPRLGLLGPIGPLGTQLCVLNGIALAFRTRGQPHVCLTYQGEGATRTGASHEGFAFAAAQRLPMVVVLEHNRWSFSTRSARQAAVESWTDVAKAYGVPAIGVDGNDVLAVYDATGEGVTRARSGGGPTIVVAETYRMLGHAQHDNQPYVPKRELDRWRERDPIALFEHYLREREIVTAEGLASMRAEVDGELEEADREAQLDPMPRPADARSGVYGPSEPDITPWTRAHPVGYADLAVSSLEPGERV
jgi:pyruvate dehydrogenase E1 component alpha subunit/2-oxoisovalerate dehydrogenase E1 component alpha subunit